jgi:type II secretory pathway component PulM
MKQSKAETKTAPLGYLLLTLMSVLLVALWIYVEQWQQLTHKLVATEAKLLSLQQQTAQYNALLGPQKTSWQVFHSHRQMNGWLKTQQMEYLSDIGVSLPDTDYKDGVQLTIQATQHAALMQWLYAQQATSNMRIHTIQLEENKANKANKANGQATGQVSGSLILSFWPKEPLAH